MEGNLEMSIPASAMCNSNPWMDCRIWSRLPQRLVDRVVACLPAPAFFRARAVCKRWYGLIFSAGFMELYLQVSPCRQWFIFFKQKQAQGLKSIYRNGGGNGNGEGPYDYEAYLLDPEEVKWYRVGIPLVPPGVSAAASSGGVVCLVSEEGGAKTILLCNPVMGSLMALPSTLRPRLCPSIGLAISDASIDLVFAGDDLISPYAVKNLTSESFHIDAGGFYSIWGTTAPLPRLCSLDSARMVEVGGRFYCMNYSPFSVLAYDVALNHWTKIQAPMRRFLRSPSLVQTRGRLVLVAAVDKSKLNVPKSFRLWALQDCGTLWLEIDRMPQHLYNHFADLEWGRGFCSVAHGRFLLVLIKAASHRPLLFDFSSKRWSWIAPCPYTTADLHAFAYRPTLAVPVTALLDQLTTPFNSFAA